MKRNYVWFLPSLTKGPNVLFVLIDDVGWADFGYNNQMATKFGAKENSDGQIPTPNIDRLAERGLKLTSHYVHPTCTPSRYFLFHFVFFSHIKYKIWQ